LFTRALNTTTVIPVEVMTDKAALCPRVQDELPPGAWHHTSNRIETDHGQLKRHPQPMRGLTTERGATQS
jgi:transposase-like protein